jgi:hypothetical protein
MNPFFDADLRLDEDYEVELGIEEGDSEDREANAEMFWNVSRPLLILVVIF